jgi:hypothetical protein
VTALALLPLSTVVLVAEILAAPIGAIALAAWICARVMR